MEMLCEILAFLTWDQLMALNSACLSLFRASQLLYRPLRVHRPRALKDIRIVVDGPELSLQSGHFLFRPISTSKEFRGSETSIGISARKDDDDEDSEKKFYAKSDYFYRLQVPADDVSQQFSLLDGGTTAKTFGVVRSLPLTGPPSDVSVGRIVLHVNSSPTLDNGKVEQQNLVEQIDTNGRRIERVIIEFILT